MPLPIQTDPPLSPRETMPTMYDLPSEDVEELNMADEDHPLSPRETMPTMYDLPSEEVGESGMPDEYHPLQGVFLSETFQPPTYPAEKIFTALDLNLYYDGRHPTWRKRPDWFAVVGVSRLYQDCELRRSYVVWQESIDPFIVVELLSPGAEKEDLGQTLNCPALTVGVGCRKFSLDWASGRGHTAAKSGCGCAGTMFKDNGFQRRENMPSKGGNRPNKNGNAPIS